ncbi:hypothetical protein [Paenibacillus polymyxa]|nr:hypothetical protein [Paenibacillus polymyxa]
MKRVIAAVILLILIGTFLLAYKGQSTEEHTGFTTHRVISHAMGAVDGLAYTNAREAFVENYKKGSRVFEVDLMFT